MKVAIFSTSNYEISFLKNENKNNHELLFLKEALSISTVEMATGCEAVCVFVNDDVSESIIVKLSELGIKYIAVRAVGHDNVDLKKAHELGIKVANVPEYSPYAVAEHAISLIMALNRNIIQANHNVNEYNFVLDNLIGFDLNGKTAGIIGLGKIGAIVAKILHGFGCKILAYDIDHNRELIKKYDVQYLSIDEVCKQSDIISLHAPLTNSTRHLINKERLSLMKNGVMIINTGRGPLLNTIDVLEALETGKIGYLGLDVYEFEKGLFFKDHSKQIPKDDLFAKLITFKNVLITGHQAFLTKNALQNIAETTLYNLNCWQEDKRSDFEL